MANLDPQGDDTDVIPETPLKVLSQNKSGLGLTPVDLSQFSYKQRGPSASQKSDGGSARSPGDTDDDEVVLVRPRSRNKVVLDSDEEEEEEEEKDGDKDDAKSVVTVGSADLDRRTSTLSLDDVIGPGKRPAKRRRMVIDNDSEDDEDYADIFASKSKQQLAAAAAPPSAGGSADEGLARLIDVFPSRSVEELKNALECFGSVETACEQLLAGGLDFSPSSSKGKSSSKSAPKPKETSKPKPRQKRVISSDEEEAVSTDEEGVDQYAYMDKPKVLQLFEECTEKQLERFPGCSSKRAALIVSLRPFTSFGDLGAKMENTKGLTPQLVHGCQEMLDELAEVDRVMQRCESISDEMRRLCLDVRDDEDFADPGDSAKKASLVGQPSSITGTLKSYQLVGLNWLALLYQHNLGGILADEMGLGKTLQAISFLAYALEHGDSGPHLVVCPSSTVNNWVRELTRWCPTLSVAPYYGSQADREDLREELRGDMGAYNVIVTTYSVCVGPVDRKFLRRFEYSIMVLDEGHMLKNMGSQRYAQLMTFEAKHRLLLTGTPLQNNLLELISLLNFIMPSMFASNKETLTRIFSGNRFASKEESDEIDTELDMVRRAQRIMRPFVLRRLKNDVLQDLPGKTVEVVNLRVTGEQERLYTELAADFKRQKLQGLGLNKLQNVCMQLRKMANHPLLHRHRYGTEVLRDMSKAILREPEFYDSDVNLVFEDMEVMSDFELHQLCCKYKSIRKHKLPEEVLFDSAKMRYLAETLPTMKQNGDRILVFSQFTSILDILEVFLKHEGHEYIRLDGSTAVSERQELIDRYNDSDEVFIFLLSTRAGGVGINLTAANTVIAHDISFNPHDDRQAEDRAHRVGQTRDVKVLKLVAENTIEAAILHRATEKLNLEKQLTAEDDTDATSQSKDLKAILEEGLGL